MSAYPDSEINVQAAPSAGLSPAQFAALAVAAAVLGLATIWPTVYSLWTLWTIDALKSIGMIIPPVSLVLILRVWRGQGWQAEGTWWGLPILLLVMAVEWTQRRALLLLVVSPHWTAVLPPPSLMLLAYGSGVVLLLAGVRLYRAALFPIALLWFANPVPHAFSLLVDLPLQTASAHIARAFAMALGQPLTPDHLRLMFTPEFGMFIAPGCNGIRGSLTMGFIALIAGYVYRFRWYTTTLVVTGAILLGYVFNLLRLCLLVVYYVIALHLPWLQNKAENADYLIGAGLFLLATMLLFTVILHLRDARNPSTLKPSDIAERSRSWARARPMRYAQLAAMGAIALAGCAALAQTMETAHSSAGTIAHAGGFPARLGSYKLERTWDETVDTGQVVYVWAQYSPPDGGAPVAIGVSPILGWHDPLICHAIRGEHPAWQGPLTVATADMLPISFSSAYYNDGVTQSLEAQTLCRGASCDEFATERTHFGFVFTRPDPKVLLSGDGARVIPVLLRAETLGTALPDDTARRQLTQDLRAFLASVRLDELTRPYNH